MKETADTLDALERYTVGRNFGTVLGAGLILLLLGLLALGGSAFTGFVTVLVVGIALVAAGIAQLAQAFLARGAPGVMTHVFMGVLDVVVGVLFISRPGVAAATLSLMLIAFFWVGGLTRIVSASALRHAGWGWSVVSGLIGIVLGFIVLSGWPAISIWLIGAFVGIELLATGGALTAFGISARQWLHQQQRTQPRSEAPGAQREASPPPREPPAPPPPA